jgi:methionine-gamma-lyase
MTRRPNRRLGLATRAIHHGYDPASAEGALAPPIHLTSTYVFETAEAGAEIFSGRRPGYVYGRTKNPTQSILEERLAELEGAEAGLALASGMAAISATFWTLLQAGDTVVADRILYGNSYAFLTKGLTRFGVKVELVDFQDLAAVGAAAAGAKILYFETPANPNLRVIDIAAVARIARNAGALSIVDNTFATPVLQRPLEHGADLVVHSVTKFLGGHGDLLAGAVLGRTGVVSEIRLHGLRYLTGAALSPHAAFLVLRGLKTLELRVRQHTASATAIADRLAGHPAIATIHYPGRSGDASDAIAGRQMQGGGGLLSLELRGGHQAALAFMNALEIVSRGVSLGDAESLIQHPASMTHLTYGPAERKRHGISDGLVRLSVGLETTEDLVDDVEQALAAVVKEAA